MKISKERKGGKVPRRETTRAIVLTDPTNTADILIKIKKTKSGRLSPS